MQSIGESGKQKRTSAPTRQDVARLAGVSTAVVSYVVNGNPKKVSDATRKRVLAVVKEIGYRPDARGRALSLGTTHTYGLAAPDLSNTFHAWIATSIDKEMSARGWSMTLAHARGDIDKEKKILLGMMDRGVEGIVLLSSTTSDDAWIDRHLRVPTVLMDRSVGLAGHYTLGPQFVEGGFLATQHLIEHGCTRVLPVFGGFSPESRRPRMLGYLRAMRENGFAPMEPLATEWGREGGARAADVLMRMDVLPDGVFCLSDMMAVGLLQRLQYAGIRIPEDIAVVSFDGTEAAKFAFPALTAVTQPVEAMAEYAVEALSRPAPQGVDHREFSVQLVCRDSCGCGIRN